MMYIILCFIKEIPSPGLKTSPQFRQVISIPFSILLVDKEEDLHDGHKTELCIRFNLLQYIKTKSFSF